MASPNSGAVSGDDGGLAFVFQVHEFLLTALIGRTEVDVFVARTDTSSYCLLLRRLG